MRKYKKKSNTFDKIVFFYTIAWLYALYFLLLPTWEKILTHRNMTLYELMVILDPKISADERKAILDRLLPLFTEL